MVVSWFPTAYPTGPAYGDPELMTWRHFTEVFWLRREGPKDGPGFVPARFNLEPDGQHVRRVKSNLVARTFIALDIETNKATGEIPPPPQEALRRAERLGLACLVYTSHSHTPDQNIRYRVVLPLSEEIAPEIPASEIMAKQLGLDGVMDGSKAGGASFFYLPSCEIDDGSHFTEVVDGNAVDAAWITAEGKRILEAERAEARRIADEAQAAAAARRAAKIAAGFDPEDSLIEKIRVHLDLEQILLAHGYDKSGTKFRHPASSSGQFGADIKNLGGVDRVFSHNAGDPLHASNLPNWCGVTALDAFDVVAILDFNGDRKEALSGLAAKFGLDKASERKALGGLLFRMIRRRATQADIEATALAEGERLGLSRDEVCRVATWVAQQAIGDAA